MFITLQIFVKSHISNAIALFLLTYSCEWAVDKAAVITGCGKAMPIL